MALRVTDAKPNILILLDMPCSAVRPDYRRLMDQRSSWRPPNPFPRCWTLHLPCIKSEIKWSALRESWYLKIIGAAFLHFFMCMSARTSFCSKGLPVIYLHRSQLPWTFFSPVPGKSLVMSHPTSLSLTWVPRPVLASQFTHDSLVQ